LVGESGLLAASSIMNARQLETDAVDTYAKRLLDRFGLQSGLARSRSTTVDLSSTIGPCLLQRPWFVRHLLLDRWFLHAGDAALAA
jgi:hypothetical protein